MAEKILNARFAQKIDTLERWGQSSIVLKNGEIAFATVAATSGSGLTEPVIIAKIGDGTSTFSELGNSFYAKASDVYGWAKLQNPTVDQLPDHLKTAIKNLQSAVGDGGSVAESIANAINALDVDAVTATTKNMIASVGEVDGKVVVTTREITADDIPTLEMDKINGLSGAIADAKSGAETTAANALAGAKSELEGKIALKADQTALDAVSAVAEAATTVSEVDAQIDTKITALNLGTTYEPIGAEDRAKGYVDQKFTDANLNQYTTEQEVKDIVDGVIAGAADSETYNSLTKLVDYIDTHGGEAADMAQAIDTLEGKVETIEGKPAYGITATQISNWDNEVGAKALAETKTTTAEVKVQIEAYKYATEEALGAETKARTDTIAAINTAISGDTFNPTENPNPTSINAKIDAINYHNEQTGFGNEQRFGAIENTLEGHGDIVTHNVAEFATAAQGAKADSAVQSVTSVTGNGITATTTSNAVVIDWDSAVTFVFDAGDSGVQA